MFGMHKGDRERTSEPTEDRSGRYGASRAGQASWEDDPEMDADTEERVQKAMESVRAALVPTIKGMVNNPDAVRFDLTAGVKMVIATVRPSKSDIGYVIGRRGMNADALRTVGTALTAKFKVGFILEVVD